ncbi:MAG: signal peptidase II [Bradymonadia bacterium]|jgi:signal peptidase II
MEYHAGSRPLTRLMPIAPASALPFSLRRFSAFAAGLTMLAFSDQWTKWFAVRRLWPGHMPVDGDNLTSPPYAIFDWLSMRLAGNKGAANSLFATLPDGWRIPSLVGFTLIALAVLIVLFSRTTARLDAIALTCIAGGAVGNLCDRVRLGYVVDFISWRMGAWTLPTFNLADVAICAGVGLLFVAGIRQPDALLTPRSANLLR